MSWSSLSMFVCSCCFERVCVHVILEREKTETRAFNLRRFEDRSGGALPVITKRVAGGVSLSSSLSLSLSLSLSAWLSVPPHSLPPLEWQSPPTLIAVLVRKDFKETECTTGPMSWGHSVSHRGKK